MIRAYYKIEQVRGMKSGWYWFDHSADTTDDLLSVLKESHRRRNGPTVYSTVIIPDTSIRYKFDISSATMSTIPEDEFLMILLQAKAWYQND
jgi:hypothetical protein